MYQIVQGRNLGYERHFSPHEISRPQWPMYSTELGNFPPGFDVKRGIAPQISR